VLLGERRRREHRVGVEIKPMIAQHHDVDVVALHAKSYQRGHGRHHPGRREVDLTAHE
jgi:hypothetical protein